MEIEDSVAMSFINVEIASYGREFEEITSFAEF